MKKSIEQSLNDYCVMALNGIGVLALWLILLLALVLLFPFWCVGKLAGGLLDWWEGE